MLRKIPLLFFILLVTAAANAHYYFKDIISNKQLIADMTAYKENKVRTITLKSFEDNGSESEGFFCEKKLSRDYRKAELFTRADIAPASLFTSIFDKDGMLLSTKDSSDLSVTDIVYTYDDKRRIASVISHIKSNDDDFINIISQEHIYTYNENNQPEKMILVKNKNDSTIILFGYDDKGNVSIEKDTKNGTKFFYYYDSKKNLTDIVQANEYSKRLKPDYVFEYNSAGKITQMTAVEEGSNNYFIWKYTYDNGLRIKEKCFTNEKRLMGSIEYEYK